MDNLPGIQSLLGNIPFLYHILIKHVPLTRDPTRHLQSQANLQYVRHTDPIETISDLSEPPKVTGLPQKAVSSFGTELRTQKIPEMIVGAFTSNAAASLVPKDSQQ